MKRVKTFLLLCAFSAWLPDSLSAAIYSVVVDHLNSDNEKVVSAIRKQAAATDQILVFEIVKANIKDPIMKGRFLSKVAAGQIVIPIGNPATELISTELEDVPTFFVGASWVSGDYLKAENVSGILSYSPAELVQVIKDIIPSTTHIGIVYTEGYSNIVADVAQAAKNQQIGVIKSVVGQKKEIGPAFRDVLSRSSLVWVPGDPAFVKGIGFEFIMGESLIRLHPIVGSDVEEVRQGALFCLLPDYNRLGYQTENAIKRIRETAPALPKKRIEYSSSSDTVAMNAHIARKLNVSAPSDLKVRWIE